ncbi:MAG TPA: LysR family transcriptional regulator [Candidatus Acidoferrales bacterium]|nr:LysR family transcriptional regulator [Candidatus Acidoferrales bacterium]
MDFDQLETFLEVARNLSFSRAAEKRFRTQPAISAQIRALEEEVGVKLLDRTGGKVSVTAAGKVFVTYCEETMEARRHVLNSMAEMERVPRGEIVVAANEGTCLHVLPEVFAQFKKAYPEVGITVQRSESREVLEAIIDNSADFGVVSMPVDDKRLSTVLIHRDDLVLIVAPKHPLTKLDKVRIAEIGQYPVLLPKLGRTREAIDRIFDENNIKPNVSMELDSSELLKAFVSAGVGVGFIASSNAESDVKLGNLVRIRPHGIDVRRDLALVFRKDKALSRAALAFIEITVKLKSPKAATVRS